MRRTGSQVEPKARSPRMTLYHSASLSSIPTASKFKGGDATTTSMSPSASPNRRRFGTPTPNSNAEGDCPAYRARTKTPPMFLSSPFSPIKASGNQAPFSPDITKNPVSTPKAASPRSSRSSGISPRGSATRTTSPRVASPRSPSPRSPRDGATLSPRSTESPSPTQKPEYSGIYRKKLPTLLAEFTILADIVQDHPDWVAELYQKLLVTLEDHIYKNHLKTCGTCRTQSEFQHTRVRGQELPAKALNSLCGDGLKELVVILQASLASERDGSCGLQAVKDFKQEVKDFEKLVGNSQYIEHEKTTMVMMTAFKERAAQKLASLEADVVTRKAEWCRFFASTLGVTWKEETKQALSSIWRVESTPKPKKAPAKPKPKPKAAPKVNSAPRPPLEPEDETMDVKVGSQESMHVVVRVRPMVEFEVHRGDTRAISVEADGKSVSVVGAGKPPKSHTLKVKQCMAEDMSQAEFFQRSRVSRLIHLACEGYIATAFAYGQTGSGKTYTMTGPDDCIGANADDSVKLPCPDSIRAIADDLRTEAVSKRGVIPRAVACLYKRIEFLKQRNPGTSFTIRASYVEIYNERVMDLLEPSRTDLPVRECAPPKVGFKVDGVTEVECLCPDDLLKVAAIGAYNRHVAPKALNKDSSRSHAVLTIELERRGPDGFTAGKLSLVDLAGSERMKQVKAGEGNQVETGYINKSLLALSNAISGLSSKDQVQYRDSKLTKLLMEGIAGKGITLLVATVSPSKTYVNESANTLFFAQKAANIVKETTKASVSVSEENRNLKIENALLLKRVQALEAENERLTSLCKSHGLE